MSNSLAGSGRNAVLAGCALLVLSTLPNAAGAESGAYACKVDIASGLKWEDSRWKVRRLFAEKFELVMEGDTFTPASVEKALASGPVTCGARPGGRISCMDMRGGYLLYDTRTARGGIAQLNGATDDRQNKRDTISVEAFSCERR